MTAHGIISALIIRLIIGALGLVAALVGSLIARAFGVENTPGVDWIELFIQVALAAVGVGIAVGIGGSRRRTYP